MNLIENAIRTLLTTEATVGWERLSLREQREYGMERTHAFYVGQPVTAAQLASTAQMFGAIEYADTHITQRMREISEKVAAVLVQL